MAYDIVLGVLLAPYSPAVNLPGFYYFANFSAGVVASSLCPEDTYGPGLRKQRACVSCPVGFSTVGHAGRATPTACGKKALLSGDFKIVVVRDRR